ncbi:MAG TPA: 7-cyano-7-deazaguanine synthase [Elusimicrobiales bacterium]|nr:7-cyano-7-deazaguanine synthase [Elusimicrobiales bacterium]
MEPKICKKCVLPESLPEIRLDSEGVCNICREHESWEAIKEPPLLESDSVKIMARHKGQHEYDCLVMCSGGKDSTASLYYMKRRYKLKPLAFMFDHGFETEDAVRNVRGAVEKLDVDFLTFRSTFMHDIFSKILKTGSQAVICHLCSIWYMDLTYRMAEKFDIPVIIAGWTKGQTTKQPVLSKCACNVAEPEYKRMGEATKKFIDEHLKTDPRYKDFPHSMEEVLARARKRHNCLVLSPHWFLPYGSEDYVETIKKELGWECPALSYPAKSTNCYLNFISVHNSMKHFGYTHYHVEMSKMIRQGLLTREEALELLKPNYDTALLNKIAEKLDYRFD